MEILNDTVIIPCEHATNVEENTESLTLKVPANVLYNLYNNGKRCICKISGELLFTFEIISAYKRGGDKIRYTFLATFGVAPQNNQSCFFTGYDNEEPVFIVEG